jgi:hypothetical protein
MDQNDKLYQVLIEMEKHLADIAASLTTLARVGQHAFPEGIRNQPPSGPRTRQGD